MQYQHLSNIDIGGQLSNWHMDINLVISKDINRIDALGLKTKIPRPCRHPMHMKISISENHNLGGRLVYTKHARSYASFSLCMLSLQLFCLAFSANIELVKWNKEQKLHFLFYCNGLCIATGRPIE